MTDAPDASTTEPGVTRPFADVLLNLNRGKTHTELSTHLQDLVAAVTATGKKGSLTLTITIAPTKSDGALEVTDTVTVKSPRHDRGSSLFFADDNHNLVREDPRQMQLPLRDVSADPSDRPLREAQ